MSKHLTSAEREAREDLETRTGAASGAGDDGDGKKRKITKPRMLKGDKAAAAHWTRILKIMKGLEILDALDAAKVNVEYSYAFAFHHGEKAVLVFRFEDNAKAVAALSAAGIDVLAFADILTDAK
jgi:hypothetical protein